MMITSDRLTAAKIVRAITEATLARVTSGSHSAKTRTVRLARTVARAGVRVRRLMTAIHAGSQPWLPRP